MTILERLLGISCYICGRSLKEEHTVIKLSIEKKQNKAMTVEPERYICAYCWVTRPLSSASRMKVAL